MKILKKLLSILPIIIFLASFLIIINTAISLTRGKAPKIFAYSFAIVGSESMEPSYNVNDLVIIKAQKEYFEQDVVTFYYDIDKNGTLEIVTHRIINISGDDYKMKGVNPEIAEDDFQIITKDDIIGKVINKSVFLGNILAGSVLKNRQIIFGVITLLLVIFIIYQFVSIMKTLKTKDDNLKKDIVAILKLAKKVIIVPGYGMALAQAENLVKELADKLRQQGASVKYALHPLAGRKADHIKSLLLEANIDEKDLYSLDDINPEFKDSDLCIIVGANDILNPKLKSIEENPIYGMQVLEVDACPNIIIFNNDLNPGYAGLSNPLYLKEKGLYFELGNATDTLKKVLEQL